MVSDDLYPNLMICAGLKFVFTSTEYLLGTDILVAPILEEGQTTRKVYLPKGTWLAEGDSNKVFNGGQWYDYPAPLNVLPYFVLRTN